MTRQPCPKCGRPKANADDWAREMAHSTTCVDERCRFLEALCFGLDGTCQPVKPAKGAK